MLFRILFLVFIVGYAVGVDLQENGIDLKEAQVSLSEIDWNQRMEENLQEKGYSENSGETVFFYPFLKSLMVGVAFLFSATLYFGIFVSEIFFIPLGGFAPVLVIIMLLNAVTFGFLFKVLFAGFVLLLEKIGILKIGGK